MNMLICINIKPKFIKVYARISREPTNHDDLISEAPGFGSSPHEPDVYVYRV